MAKHDRVLGETRSIVTETSREDLQVCAADSDERHADKYFAWLETGDAPFFQACLVWGLHDDGWKPMVEEHLGPAGRVAEAVTVDDSTERAHQFLVAKPDDLTRQRAETALPRNVPKVEDAPRKLAQYLSGYLAHQTDPDPPSGDAFAVVSPANLRPGLGVDMDDGGPGLIHELVVELHALLRPLDVLEARQALIERTGLPQLPLDGRVRIVG